MPKGATWLHIQWTQAKTFKKVISCRQNYLNSLEYLLGHLHCIMHFQMIEFIELIVLISLGLCFLCVYTYSIRIIILSITRYGCFFPGCKGCITVYLNISNLIWRCYLSEINSNYLFLLSHKIYIYIFLLKYVMRTLNSIWVITM